VTTPREWRVAQLSDCHVAADARARYRGEDARANLEAMLRAVAAWRPDLLLLTGDLAEDGSEAAYAWLAGTFRSTGVPLAVLPGNHDDPARMAAVFGAPAWPAVVEGEAWRIVLADSTVAGEPSGAFDRERLDALERALASQPGLPTLVALHHQPRPVESAWIDRFPLRDGASAVRALVRAAPGIRAVTWGHVHSAYRREDGGILWLGTPSTVSNSRPFVPTFTPDPSGPAARWFRLFDDGRLATGILRAGA
jgi:Icc protein